MRTRFASWGILACAAFLSTAFSSREAHAKACTVASDCPRGFDCEPTGTASDGGPAEACTSLPCQSDSDCGPGLRCYIDMNTQCPPGDSSCSPNACVPQWDAPCATDSDCGPGFSCSAGPKSWNCGSDQDASQPPYVTSMIVPCSAVPLPGPPGFDASSLPFPLPAICDAGSSCLYTTWNTCIAQQTPTCTVASQCPSTWTCQCPASCGGSDVSGETTVDAGCTLACVAPNSDLLPFEGCFGAAEGTSNGGTATPVGTPATDSGVAGGSASAGSGSSHGGCQVGRGDGATGWPLGPIGVFAWASRRESRKRRRRAERVA